MDIITKDRQDSHSTVNPVEDNASNTFSDIRIIQTKNSEKVRCPEHLKDCCSSEKRCGECLFGDCHCTRGGNNNERNI